MNYYLVYYLLFSFRIIIVVLKFINLFSLKQIITPYIFNRAEGMLLSRYI